MSLKSVSLLNFTQPAKTKEGNEYKKTNAGKYIGTSTGVALGGVYSYNFAKAVKKSYNLKKCIIDVMYKNVLKATKKDNMKDMLTDLEIDSKQFRANRTKVFKSSLKCFLPVLTLLIAGVGLAAGVVSDKVVNNFRAKKADKQVQNV